MKVEFDPAKEERNLRERGLSFTAILAIDPLSMRIFEDNRKDYGEPRYRAYGTLNARLHMFVFTWRGDAMRIISFRKANQREVAWYEKVTS